MPFGVITPEHSGRPVLCLTIIDHPLSQAVTEKTSVLLGVRKPETNRTHPGVLSSPTKRFPMGTMHAMHKELNFLSQIDWTLGDETSNSYTAVQDTVQALICTKLGIQPTTDKILCHSRFGWIETGIPKQLCKDDTLEPVTMYNVLCHFEGLNIPSNTASYTDIGFYPVGDFLSGKLESQAQICAGLCIATSKKVLASLLFED